MIFSDQKKNKKIIFRPDKSTFTSYSGDASSSAKKGVPPANQLAKTFDSIMDKIDLLYLDSMEDFPMSDLTNNKVKIMSQSKDSDYYIISNIDNLGEYKKSSNKDQNIGFYQKISNNDDIEYIKKVCQDGISFVIIDVEDWKIIPLENLIASLQNTGVEIFASAKSVEEVETLFTVLELGVDGVIVSTGNNEVIEKVHSLIKEPTIKLQGATIKEIKDVGIGERVCIDTVSMLSKGEGMLVGNKSNFLFLIHNESIGSSFTSPRPFRVNAGAVHCYTITPEGKTKYLSELEAGSKVCIVNNFGDSRFVSVGRSKIETRPLRLFKAEDSSGEIGSVIVQNAETIRFISEDKDILPVTHAKVGDKILVSSSPPKGRHFGMEVSDEYILEK